MKRPLRHFSRFLVVIALLLPAYATHANSQQPGLTSVAILKKALSSFGKNFPAKPFCLDTYYRDFQENDGKNINLTEAVIKLCDKGFTIPAMKDEFTITHFRKNESTTGVPFSPVINRSLIVSGVHFPDVIQNNLTAGDYGAELSILIASDPIRNYNLRSLPFIDTLNRNFLQNHNFSPPVLNEAGATGIYVISFNGKPSVTGDSLVINGKISVNSSNYAIRSFEYSCFQAVRKGKSLKELFSFRADYTLNASTDSLQYLSFLSLRNLCNVYDVSDSLNLKIVDSGWNIFKNINPTLFIKFNNPLDQESALKRENYIARCLKDTIKINSIQAVGNTLYIRFKTSDLKMPLDSCRVFAENLKDIYGNVFSKPREKAIYQTREIRVIRVNGNNPQPDAAAQAKKNNN